MRENIGDLPDRHDVAARRSGAIEDGRLRRRHREVAPVRGAVEIRSRGADERTSNDAPDTQRIDEAAGNRAHLVKAGKPNVPSCAAIWKTLSTDV